MGYKTILKAISSLNKRVIMNYRTCEILAIEINIAKLLYLHVSIWELTFCILLKKLFSNIGVFESH